MALAGNELIPLLSLCALVASLVWAIGVMTGGWWARNLRSPSRRVMLVGAVPAQERRSAAFGFLHALDVGGGALAGVYVLAALAAHVPFRWIFVATVVPLAISTLSLLRAHVGGRHPTEPAAATSEEARSWPRRLPGRYSPPRRCTASPTTASGSPSSPSPRAAAVRSPVSARFSCSKPRRYSPATSSAPGSEPVPLTSLPAWVGERSRHSDIVLSVAMLDLDGFKAVNDHLGHDACGRLIKDVTHAWQASVRGGGDFLARLGGDEFRLLAPSSAETGICRFTERLADALTVGVSASRRRRQLGAERERLGPAATGRRVRLPDEAATPAREAAPPRMTGTLADTGRVHTS